MNLLLRLNPEFQKNLWLELTIGRLAGMPIVLGLMAGACYLLFGEDTAVAAMLLVSGAMLVVWGTRAATDSVSDELNSRTWDIHRLGARGATSLILGKLLGSTIYIWYGAVLAMGAAAYFQHDRWHDVLNVSLCGLLAQSTALFAAMALKGNGRTRRGYNLAAQASAWFITLMVRYAFSLGGTHSEFVTWYQQSVKTIDFINAASGLAALWMIIGAIRLMRRDLGFRDGPWFWGLFTLCLAGVAAGFVGLFGAASKVSISLDDQADAAYYLMPYLLAIAATYVALLGGQSGYGRWSRMTFRMRSHQFGKAWSEVPSWVIGLIVSVICGEVLCVPHPEFSPLCLALAGFMVRDAIVVTGISLGQEHRAGMLMTIYFLLVGVVAPWLVNGKDQWAAIFIPVTAGGWKAAAFPWGECLIALVGFATAFVHTWKASAPAKTSTLPEGGQAA
jgi:hypothetical protein